MPETRKSFSPSKILKIVGFAEPDGNRLAGRHFEVSNSNIRLWRKNKPYVKEMN